MHFKWKLSLLSIASVWTLIKWSLLKYFDKIVGWKLSQTSHPQRIPFTQARSQLSFNLWTAYVPIPFKIHFISSAVIIIMSKCHKLRQCQRYAFPQIIIWMTVKHGTTYFVCVFSLFECISWLAEWMTNLVHGIQC